MNVARSLFTIAALLLIAVTPAWSQQRGGTGSFGSSLGGGFGGGGGNGMSMGAMSGGGGFGGMSGGMGGMSSGMGGMGGMGGGMGGFGTGMGGGGFGQSGMNNMQGGQQSFIGRDSNDMSAIFQQMGRSSNQFLQQLNRTMGRGRRNTSQEENAALAVRVRLDVAFDQPQVQPTVVANNVRTRLASTLTKRSVMAPEVEVAGDTVVLRGVAKSESQRMVIEQLVRMEPGVFAVDNQMTVASPSDTQPSAPVPSK